MNGHRRIDRELYSEVHCFLFSWSLTDLDLDREVAQFGRILEFGFHFFVHECKLVSEQSMKRDIDNIFRLHGDDPNKLLLIYYGGHGGTLADRMCFSNGFASHHALGRHITNH